MFRAPILVATVSIRIYEGVSKSFRTGRQERELQMVQLSATRCSCIAILWVSLVIFAANTLCVASQRVFAAAVYFVIDPRMYVYVYFCKRFRVWNWVVLIKKAVADESEICTGITKVSTLVTPSASSCNAIIRVLFIKGLCCGVP
jgi:hypothetical protein